MRRETRPLPALPAPSLTEQGMLWAVVNLNKSLSARIAVQGEECGWPALIVLRSVKICNAAARLELDRVAV